MNSRVALAHALKPRQRATFLLALNSASFPLSTSTFSCKATCRDRLCGKHSWVQRGIFPTGTKTSQNAARLIQVPMYHSLCSFALWEVEEWRDLVHSQHNFLWRFDWWSSLPPWEETNFPRQACYALGGGGGGVDELPVMITRRCRSTQDCRSHWNYHPGQTKISCSTSVLTRNEKIHSHQSREDS